LIHCALYSASAADYQNSTCVQVPEQSVERQKLLLRGQELRNQMKQFMVIYIALCTRDPFLPLCILCRAILAKSGPSVCLPVRPSVCQTGELLQNERNFCPHSYTVWKGDACSFAAGRMVSGGRPLLTEILSQTDTPFKNADFQSIFVHSTSAVIPSGRSSVITNRKSTTHFPVSLR